MTDTIDRSLFIAWLIVKNQCKTIAEIGVSKGDNARRILMLLEQNFDKYQLDKFYLIDLPERDKNPIYHFSHSKLIGPDRRFIKYIAKPSLEAVNLIEDESLDLVFLDGDHSEQAFEPDIKAWLTKLKIGGILCGDEYAASDGHSCHYRTKVLDRLFKNLNHSREEKMSEGKTTELWWIKKGE